MEQKQGWNALEQYVNVEMRTDGCLGNPIENLPFATGCSLAYGLTPISRCTTCLALPAASSKSRHRERSSPTIVIVGVRAQALRWHGKGKVLRQDTQDTHIMFDCLTYSVYYAADV